MFWKVQRVMSAGEACCGRKRPLPWVSPAVMCPLLPSWKWLTMVMSRMRSNSKDLRDFSLQLEESFPLLLFVLILQLILLVEGPKVVIKKNPGISLNNNNLRKMNHYHAQSVLLQQQQLPPAALLPLVLRRPPLLSLIWTLRNGCFTHHVWMTQVKYYMSVAVSRIVKVWKEVKAVHLLIGGTVCPNVKRHPRRVMGRHTR